MPHATTHIFCKTSLQFARTGEDVNRPVAGDARVSESVMMSKYVRETDEEMRARSNRTFRRTLAGLSPEVTRRFGHVDSDAALLELLRRLEGMEGKLRHAITAKDWRQVAELASRLAAAKEPPKAQEPGLEGRASCEIL